MTKLFVPQPGQRVRVTEIAQFEHSPEHKVGDEVVIGESGQRNQAFESREYPGWLLLDDGTYCHVELVVERSFFERLADRIRALVGRLSGPPELSGHQPPDAELSRAEIVVLRMLSDGSERYGLDLVKASNCALSRGLVYLELEGMEDKRLVESRDETAPPPDYIGIRRRLYRITDRGARALQETDAREDDGKH